MVQGDEDVGPKPFCCSDDRRIGPAQRKVSVPLHEIGDPRPVLRERGLYIEFFETAEKARFGPRPPTTVDQVGGLRHAERRNNEVETRSLKD
jgi:hypothetical protein